LRDEIVERHVRFQLLRLMVNSQTLAALRCNSFALVRKAVAA
jgi:hypothetical protein